MKTKTGGASTSSTASKNASSQKQGAASKSGTNGASRGSANGSSKSPSNGSSNSSNGSSKNSSGDTSRSAMGNSKGSMANSKNSSGGGMKGSSNVSSKNASNGSGKNASASSGNTGGASKNGSGNSRSSSKGQGVKASSDAASGLNELFEAQLQDIYWAEKALTKALPKMAKNATSEELRGALEDHLSVTEEQVKRLEEVFSVIGKPAKAKKCEAMNGLIKEAEEIMKETEKGVVRDAGIIAAGQKVEHYEIASYGTLAAFAKTLGENEAADLLNETLEEEKEADQTLTQVAESAINVGAANEDDEEEDDDDSEEEDDDSEEDDKEEDDDDSEEGEGDKKKK